MFPLNVKTTQTRSFCYEFSMLYVIEATRSDGRRDRATVTSETLAPTHNVFFGPLSLNPSLAPGAGGRVGPPRRPFLWVRLPACDLTPREEQGTEIDTFLSLVLPPSL